MAGGQWVGELGGIMWEANGKSYGLLASSTLEAGAAAWAPSSRGGGGGEGGRDGPQWTWDDPAAPAAHGIPEYAVASSPEDAGAAVKLEETASPAAGCRRKKRRARSSKNEEEVRYQRMTHIAVERNRRKQMNEHLAALRAMMPAFYVQRGDQASIVGGAINFVKELEQLLQTLEAQKRIKQQQPPESEEEEEEKQPAESSATMFDLRKRSATADVDVRMVDNHANVKVLSPRRPQQLLRIVTGFQGLRLTTLHLNVSTVDRMVLYSFSLKVEDDCRLSSVEEIATAVQLMIGKIQEESAAIHEATAF